MTLTLSRKIVVIRLFAYTWKRTKKYIFGIYVQTFFTYLNGNEHASITRIKRDLTIDMREGSA